MVNLLLTTTLSQNKWGGEAERLVLQRDLLAKYAPGRTIYVVAPDKELPAVRSLISHENLNHRFFAEESIVPHLHAWKWYRQQQVKLLAYTFVEDADFVVTLDSDVYPWNHLTTGDFLTMNNRAYVHLEPIESSHPASISWSLYTSQMRSMIPASDAWPVTPCVYSLKALQSVVSLFDMRRLSKEIGWAEHAVYHYGLIASGEFSKYHVSSDQPTCFYIHSLGETKRQKTPFFCASSDVGFNTNYVRQQLQILGVL